MHVQIVPLSSIFSFSEKCVMYLVRESGNNILMLKDFTYLKNCHKSGTRVYVIAKVSKNVMEIKNSNAHTIHTFYYNYTTGNEECVRFVICSELKFNSTSISGGGTFDFVEKIPYAKKQESYHFECSDYSANDMYIIHLKNNSQDIIYRTRYYDSLIHGKDSRPINFFYKKN